MIGASNYLIINFVGLGYVQTDPWPVLYCGTCVRILLTFIAYTCDDLCRKLATVFSKEGRIFRKNTVYGYTCSDKKKKKKKD